MLKLKLQYFGHLMRRADSFEKTLILGKIEGRRRRGHNRGWDGWMASLPQWTWVWVNSGSWWWTGRPGMLQFMGLQRVRHNWTAELNWTATLVRPRRQTRNFFFFECKLFFPFHTNSIKLVGQWRHLLPVPEVSLVITLCLPYAYMSLLQKGGPHLQLWKPFSTRN